VTNELVVIGVTRSLLTSRDAFVHTVGRSEFYQNHQGHREQSDSGLNERDVALVQASFLEISESCRVP
jgi:hypothetical protein